MFETHANIIADLKAESPEFLALYKRHQALDKQVDQAGSGRLAINEHALEAMKFERLQIKDQLLTMIQAAGRTEAVSVGVA